MRKKNIPAPHVKNYGCKELITFAPTAKGFLLNALLFIFGNRILNLDSTL